MANKTTVKRVKKVMVVYDPAQIAQILQLDIDTVYKLIRSQKLKAVKITSKWRITQAALDRLLEFGDRFSA